MRCLAALRVEHRDFGVEARRMCHVGVRMRSDNAGHARMRPHDASQRRAAERRAAEAPMGRSISSPDSRNTSARSFFRGPCTIWICSNSTEPPVGALCARVGAELKWCFFARAPRPADHVCRPSRGAGDAGAATHRMEAVPRPGRVRATKRTRVYRRPIPPRVLLGAPCTASGSGLAPNRAKRGSAVPRGRERHGGPGTPRGNDRTRLRRFPTRRGLSGLSAAFPDIKESKSNRLAKPRGKYWEG